jgi:hypothetical protein
MQQGRDGLMLFLGNIGFLLAVGNGGIMNYEVIVNQPGAYRVVLEERAEGVYVNVFDSPAATEPYIDILQSDLIMAKRACKQDYGIEDHEWREMAADVDWHAPG